MNPVTQAPPDDTGFVIFMVIALLIAGFIYILPTIVAFRRDHPNRWIILVINVAFGGTILGWGIALAWALRPLTGLAPQIAAASLASISSSTTSKGFRSLNHRLYRQPPYRTS
jgi:hypothetical protein